MQLLTKHRIYLEVAKSRAQSQSSANGGLTLIPVGGLGDSCIGQSLTESNTHMLQMMISATEETEQGRGIGSANGGGGMSIFKKAFRKASLDSNLSAGPGKRERESEIHRVRQHRIQDYSGMAFRTKGTSLTPCKGSFKAPQDGTGGRDLSRTTRSGTFYLSWRAVPSARH